MQTVYFRPPLTKVPGRIKIIERGAPELFILAEYHSLTIFKLVDIKFIVMKENSLYCSVQFLLVDKTFVFVLQDR